MKAGKQGREKGREERMKERNKEFREKLGKNGFII